MIQADELGTEIFDASTSFSIEHTGVRSREAGIDS
jgi:hypothetical protein